LQPDGRPTAASPSRTSAVRPSATAEALGLPPIGYRIVEAAEQPGHRTKKTLEIGSI